MLHRKDDIPHVPVWDYWLALAVVLASVFGWTYYVIGVLLP
jgi:hypothetical protein